MAKIQKPGPVSGPTGNKPPSGRAAPPNPPSWQASAAAGANLPPLAGQAQYAQDLSLRPVHGKLAVEEGLYNRSYERYLRCAKLKDLLPEPKKSEGNTLLANILLGNKFVTDRARALGLHTRTGSQIDTTDVLGDHVDTLPDPSLLKATLAAALGVDVLPSTPGGLAELGIQIHQLTGKVEELISDWLTPTSQSLGLILTDLGNMVGHTAAMVNGVNDTAAGAAGVVAAVQTAFSQLKTTTQAHQTAITGAIATCNAALATTSLVQKIPALISAWATSVQTEKTVWAATRSVLPGVSSQNTALAEALGDVVTWLTAERLRFQEDLDTFFAWLKATVTFTYPKLVFEVSSLKCVNMQDPVTQGWGSGDKMYVTWVWVSPEGLVGSVCGAEHELKKGETYTWSGGQPLKTFTNPISPLATVTLDGLDLLDEASLGSTENKIRDVLGRAYLVYVMLFERDDKADFGEKVKVVEQAARDMIEDETRGMTQAQKNSAMATLKDAITNKIIDVAIGWGGDDLVDHKSYAVIQAYPSQTFDPSKDTSPSSVLEITPTNYCETKVYENKAGPTGEYELRTRWVYTS